jgi:hypothetical protein
MRGKIPVHVPSRQIGQFLDVAGAHEKKECRSTYYRRTFGDHGLARAPEKSS